MLVLDSSGISRLAERSPRAVALLAALRSEGLWPPIVPSPVLIEALQGNSAKDASANRLLKACDVVEEIPQSLARRAAELRALARRGSAIDALVVAAAEPGGSVLTTDSSDLRAIASHAHEVVVESA
jgi:predicted nucleic acid-binding protein